MTRNEAQKTVTRRRMAATGEPYNVARRAAEAGRVTAAGRAEADADELEARAGLAKDAIEGARPRSHSHPSALAEPTRRPTRRRDMPDLA